MDVVLYICSKTGIEGFFALQSDRIFDRQAQFSEIELHIKYNETVVFYDEPAWFLSFEDPQIFRKKEEYRLRFVDERLEGNSLRIKTFNTDDYEPDTSEDEW